MLAALPRHTASSSHSHPSHAQRQGGLYPRTLLLLHLVQQQKQRQPAAQRHGWAERLVAHGQWPVEYQGAVAELMHALTEVQ